MSNVKIIQIAISETENRPTLYALTSDGRILFRDSAAWVEEKIPNLDEPSKGGYYWIEDIDKKLQA